MARYDSHELISHKVDKDRRLRGCISKVKATPFIEVEEREEFGI
jgi:hypothetical protein